MAGIDSTRPSRIRRTLSSNSALMKRRSFSLFPTLLHRISRGVLPPFYPLGSIPGICCGTKACSVGTRVFSTVNAEEKKIISSRVGSISNLPSAIVLDFIHRIIGMNGFLSPSDGGFAEFATRGTIIDIRRSPRDYSAISGTGGVLHACYPASTSYRRSWFRAIGSILYKDLLRPSRTSRFFHGTYAYSEQHQQDVVGVWSGHTPRN